MRLLWLSLGLIALALAIAGVVLPILPTTPFLLVAAFAFARSSPRLHAWLLHHRTFGPVIETWQQHGAIPRRAKKLAVAMIVGAFLLSVLLGLPAYVLGLQAMVLTAVTLFILTRPDGPSGS